MFVRRLISGSLLPEGAKVRERKAPLNLREFMALYKFYFDFDLI